MPTSFINRDQIVGKIASKIGLSKARVRRILLALEDQITCDLKHKSKVKLTDFGTLYLLERKSRTIKQVVSGKSRLLLERTVIKFKSSLKLKARLVGKILVKRTQGSGLRTQQIPKRQNQKPETGVPGPETSILPKTEDLKPKTRIVFPPLRMMPAVNREKIREKIIAKLSKLVGSQITPKRSKIDLPTAMDLRQNATGKVFLNLFRQILSQDIKMLTFSLGQNESIPIFGGRPRKQIATLPRKLVQQFLEKYCEIDNFDYPQQRFVKIKSSSRIGSIGILNLHLLPTSIGASINIKIK